MPKTRRIVCFLATQETLWLQLIPRVTPLTSAPSDLYPHAAFSLCLVICQQLAKLPNLASTTCRSIMNLKQDLMHEASRGSRSGSASPSPLPPMTSGFEVPKLSISGPCLIFCFNFFLALLCSAYHFFHILLYYFS